MRPVVKGRAASLGVVADLVFGEPPLDPHPVALFGRLMQRVEGRLYKDSRVSGAAYTTIGVAVGAGGGVVPTSAATYLTVAGRGLRDAATAVGERLDAGDLVGARSLLPALVGRDPADLDSKEIARAVVESVAENTVDAIVAPALWAAVGGAPATLAYRAINTMDSMVGHRSARYERFGSASARLDDAANWLPSRAAAGLVALVRPRRARAIAAAVRRREHPSPNAGVIEAAFAAALDLRLGGGTNRYGDRIEIRAALGDGRPPEPGDIARANRLSRDVSLALAASLALFP